MTEPASPFRGPEPLREGDPMLGREVQAAALMDRVVANRFVLLYSPSGAGKSSVINAALIPAARKRQWLIHNPVRVSRKNADGSKLNRYVASCLIDLEIQETASTQFVDYLPECKEEAELFLFDQFEEILTSDPLDEAGRVEFFRQLGNMLRVPGRRAVFAIREDYLAPLGKYLDWLPTQLSSRMRLELMTEQQAVRSINGAIKATKTVDIEDGAAELLVSDLAVGGSVEPVQLQVACKKLWHSLAKGTTFIPKSMVAGKGTFSVEGALEDFYADVVKRVAQASSVGELRIRNWFQEKLITMGAVRLQALYGDAETAETAGLPNAAVKGLEKELLVRFDEHSKKRWVELTHDRLIRPVMDNNLAWKKLNLNVLQRETELWVLSGSSADRLLRGRDLREASGWARTHNAEVSEKEQAYLDESRTASRRRMAGRGLLLALAMAMFGVLVLSVRANAISHTASAAHFAQEAIRLSQEQPDLAAAYALRAEDELRPRGLAALASFLIPKGTREEGEQAVRSGLIAAALQHDPRYTGTVSAPDALHFTTCIWYRPDGKEINLMLGDPESVNVIEAGGSRISRVDHGVEVPQKCRGVSKAVLIQGPHAWTIATEWKGEREGFRIQGEPGAKQVAYSVPYDEEPTEVAIDPRGLSVAWVNGSAKAAYVRDLRGKVTTVLPAPDLQISGIIYNPDGTLLAVASRDGSIRMFPLKDGKVEAYASIPPLRAHSDTICDIAFSPSGRELVSVGEDRRVVTWSISTGAEDHPPVAIVPGKISLRTTKVNDNTLLVSHGDHGPPAKLVLTHNVDRLAVSGDGERGIAVYTNGQFGAIALNSGKVSASQGEGVIRAALNVSGTLAATANAQGIVTVWKIANGLDVTEVKHWPALTRPQDNAVIGIAFGGRGLLATGDTANRIRFWNATPGVSSFAELFSVRTRQTPQELAFDGNGDALISLDEINVLQLWERRAQKFAVTGASLRLPFVTEALAFSPNDGSFSLVRDGGQEVNWKTDGASLHRQACHLAPKTGVQANVEGLALPASDSIYDTWMKRVCGN